MLVQYFADQDAEARLFPTAKRSIPNAILDELRDFSLRAEVAAHGWDAEGKKIFALCKQSMSDDWDTIDPLVPEGVPAINARGILANVASTFVRTGVQAFRKELTPIPPQPLAELPALQTMMRQIASTSRVLAEHGLESKRHSSSLLVGSVTKFSPDSLILFFAEFAGSECIGPAQLSKALSNYRNPVSHLRGSRQG